MINPTAIRMKISIWKPNITLSRGAAQSVKRIANSVKSEFHGNIFDYLFVLWCEWRHQSICVYNKKHAPELWLCDAVDTYIYIYQTLILRYWIVFICNSKYSIFAERTNVVWWVLSVADAKYDFSNILRYVDYLLLFFSTYICVCMLYPLREHCASWSYTKIHRSEINSQVQSNYTLYEQRVCRMQMIKKFKLISIVCSCVQKFRNRIPELS